MYISICTAYALITFLRDLLAFSGSLKASTNTYERPLHSVLFAKMQFFERPLGQITNRLSKDSPASVSRFSGCSRPTTMAST